MISGSVLSKTWSSSSAKIEKNVSSSRFRCSIEVSGIAISSGLTSALTVGSIAGLNQEATYTAVCIRLLFDFGNTTNTNAFSCLPLLIVLWLWFSFSRFYWTSKIWRGLSLAGSVATSFMHWFHITSRINWRWAGRTKWVRYSQAFCTDTGATVVACDRTRFQDNIRVCWRRVTPSIVMMLSSTWSRAICWSTLSSSLKQVGSDSRSDLLRKKSQYLFLWSSFDTIHSKANAQPQSNGPALCLTIPIVKATEARRLLVCPIMPREIDATMATVLLVHSKRQTIPNYDEEQLQGRLHLELNLSEVENRRKRRRLCHSQYPPLANNARNREIWRGKICY